jgi:hypothetical protein
MPRRDMKILEAKWESRINRHLYIVLVNIIALNSEINLNIYIEKQLNAQNQYKDKIIFLTTSTESFL